MTKKSTYRGDSPGKKVVRARAWLHAAKIMQVGYRAELNGALVLSGHGGDVSTLLGWGIPSNKITAVDMAKDALEFSAELYPEVTHHHASIQEVCKRPDVIYNTAHLDFCGGLNVPNIHATQEVMKNISLHPLKSEDGFSDGDGVGFVFVTMMRGREQDQQDNESICSQLSRAMRDEHLQHIAVGAKSAIGKQLYRHGVFNPDECTAAAEAEMRALCREMGRKYNSSDWYDPNHWFTRNRKNLTIAGTSRTRAIGMEGCVNVVLEPLGLYAHCVMVMGYQSAIRSKASGQKDEHGTPFVTAGYIVVPRKHRARHIHFLEKRAAHEHMYGKHAPLLTNSLLQDVMNKKESLDSLKAFALSLSHNVGTQRAAEILDIQKSTITAWRAHATRGTYKNIATKMKNGCPRMIVSPLREFGLTDVPCKRVDLGWGDVLNMMEPEQPSQHQYREGDPILSIGINPVNTE